MYENLLGQNTKNSLSHDISKGVLPPSILFSGNECSGKLTAALETARILACIGIDKNRHNFNCTCSSCLQYKSLTCVNLLLCGPRDCALEINAAADTFLRAYYNNAGYLDAARYLFLRSVRKLTLRFSEILYAGDDKLNKICAALGQINENLEQLDFPRQLPESAEVETLVKKTQELSLKFEKDFLYDSIPISQIRNIESWARIRSEDGKKTVIIENADRMLEGSRNALLKILEEPPSDCVFILLTSKRNAVMPTILSRVRTYSFAERSRDVQKDVVSRVFHNPSFEGSVNDYLLTYLPVKPDFLKEQAGVFVKNAGTSTVPDVSKLVKDCNSFDPRVILKIFLNEITNVLKSFLYTPEGCEVLSAIRNQIQLTWNNVSVYNQNPQAALENLFRELNKISVMNGNIIKCADL